MPRMSVRRTDPRPLTADEADALRRRSRWTQVLFFAAWAFVAAAILAIELLSVPDQVQTILILATISVFVPGILLHFTARCPVCRANLGLQHGLGVPPSCRRCGSLLQRPSGGARAD